MPLMPHLTPRLSPPTLDPSTCTPRPSSFALHSSPSHPLTTPGRSSPHIPHPPPHPSALTATPRPPACTPQPPPSTSTPRLSPLTLHPSPCTPHPSPTPLQAQGAAQADCDDRDAPPPGRRRRARPPALLLERNRERDRPVPTSGRAVLGALLGASVSRGRVGLVRSG